ncbi:MAG TPA: sodium-dependent transporter [Candidatus Aminicenantes bacterium]|nr:sodium-dependent transporter [Candidatus Aminicenantes bacterium]HPL14235.1 sodium-dependent transporter [Candidatus Aminicenantes bacterium]HQF98258.1 sodium-dependent transporter [Candidatus Aminicenantes bacterium]
MASRGKWSSHVGFILAAAGSAVGLGNIWRFPYLAGKNGGALFVLIYIACVIVLGLPVMLAELSLGRATGKNAVGAFRAIRPGTKWHWIGYLNVVTAVMVLSFYSVIAGWTLGYFVKTLGGTFKSTGKDDVVAVFSRFIASPGLQLLLLAIFIFLTVSIVSKGVSAGLEKFSKVMMPALFAILILLMVYSLTLPGAERGLAFYLKPDFSEINGRVFLEAMGQAFFSLSLGMGAMLTYGSYLSKKEKLVASAAWVAVIDTSVALLAGFIIFPALFSQNMAPDQGPGLVFAILPVIFGKIPGGTLFGAFFFVMLALAALTSTISLLEIPVSFLIDEKKLTRRRAAWLTGGAALLFGIPSSLSGGSVKFFSRLPAFHIDFLSLWDKVWGNISVSVGSLLIALFVVHVWKTDKALAEISAEGAGFRLARIWILAIKYVCPLLILVVLVSQFI